MPRTPRLEYAGALYHVTSRGVRQGAIFADDRDRAFLLALFADALRRFEARAFAYCLMGNHYHLVVQTRQANLSALMRRVNATYSQAFNRRHAGHGHVFEGRYQARHVHRDSYLLAACRYVDLNPVRARLVERPAAWPWSSYRAHVGTVAAPAWLATDELRAMLGGDYADWVEAGREVRLWASLRDGQYLGDDAFVARMQDMSRSGHGKVPIVETE